MKQLKLFMFSLMAMLMLTFTIDARANSPGSTDGYNIEQSHDFRYDVAVDADDHFGDTVNMVMITYNKESEGIPLYIQLHDSYYIEVKADDEGNLYYGEILHIPLLNYITDYPGNIDNFNTLTLAAKDYTQIGYSMKK